jgi:prepilin-type N-terminal cleavage/methylation domain-containing protein
LRREAGVTMIELLVAITLVSLLSVGMLFAMRVGVNTMNATNRRVAVNRRALGAQRILEQQIGSFLPVYANCQGTGDTKGERTFFFQGAEQVMQFVTGYSITEAHRGLPRIVQLFVAPRDDGNGLRLLENEHPYNGPFGAGLFCSPAAADPLSGVDMPRFRQPEQQPGSFVVADNLAGVRFLYQDVHPENDKVDIWVPRWTRQNRMPRALRIEIAVKELDPSRVQPVTLTIPLHVTRDMKEGVRKQ